MARNDIRFGQAQQADFGQANQMFRISQEQLDNALATGKSTLDDINKAVTSNNDAKIKQFINSFSKDELEANRDTINEFIRDVGLQSGNMYSRNEMEEYHDNRMGDLITRDNSRMLNTEKGLQHENIVAGHKANDILASIVPILHDPTTTDVDRQKAVDTAIQNAINAGESDKVISALTTGAYGSWGDYIANSVGRATGTNQLAETELTKISGMFEPLAKSVVDAQTNLENVMANQSRYPSEVAFNQAVEQATQALQTSQTNALAFMRNNESKVPMGMQLDKFNNSVANLIGQRDKARQQEWNNQYKEKELSNRTQQTANNFAVGMANAETAKQRANQDGVYQQGQLALGEAKFSHEVATGGNGSGSGNGGKGTTKLTKDNPNYTTLTKLGIKEDGSYDATEFTNKFVSAMEAVRINTEYQKNAVSFNDWIKNEGAEYAKSIHDTNLPLSWEDNLSEIQSYFPKGASEYEKIEIVKEYAVNPKLAINEKNTTTLANNAKINLENTIRKEYHKEFANILQAMSSLHPDVTADSLVALLLEKGKLPRGLYNTIPDAHLFNYADTRKANNESKNPTGKNYDDVVKELFTKRKKGSGDGTLLKDPRKMNMGDGTGAMLIDPNRSNVSSIPAKTASQVAWDMFKPNRNGYGTGIMLIDPKYRK